MKAANERLDKGLRKLQPPEDDKILKLMKQQYAERKCTEVTSGSIYNCDLCNKRFKSTEFVNKHIFNKHSDVLD